jgi:hypothetical protein
MVSRVSAGARVAVVLLPLVAALLLGGLVAEVTLSWGAFILWQLIWWSIVAAIVGWATFRLADVVVPDVPDNLPDRYLDRMLSITRWINPLGFILISAGLATSIGIMIAGNVTSAPVEVYWPLPIAAFLFTASDPVNSRLSAINDKRAHALRERQRKARCSNVTSARRGEYAAAFLMTLYRLTQTTNPPGRQIAISQITAKLKDECTPELLPVALKHWEERKFIRVERDKPNGHQSVTLLKTGSRVCGRAKSVEGITAALREHERCLQLSDREKTSYRTQLLVDIATLAPDSQNVIATAKLLSVQKHPCWQELVDPSLRELSNLGLVDLTKRVSRRGAEDFYNLGSFSFAGRRPVDSSPGVALTPKGSAVSAWIRQGNPLSVALDRYEIQLRRERDRERIERAREARCRESTHFQKIEFEDQFLRALYAATKGDTSLVLMNEVWSYLNNECKPELSPNAVRVWLERECIKLEDDKRFERGKEFALRQVMGNDLRFSLTATGRDLCIRADQIGMQEALRERREGPRVSNENYYFYGGQTGAFGHGARADHNAFAQFVNATDQIEFDELARELKKLREVLARQADSAEKHAAVGAVAGAELAAQEGDREGVWQQLAQVGKWVLDTATRIGVPVAVAAIEAVFNAR